jgi:hypothetical protein
LFAFCAVCEKITEFRRPCLKDPRTEVIARINSLQSQIVTLNSRNLFAFDHSEEIIVRSLNCKYPFSVYQASSNRMPKSILKKVQFEVASSAQSDTSSLDNASPMIDQISINNAINSPIGGSEEIASSDLQVS